MSVEVPKTPPEALKGPEQGTQPEPTAEELERKRKEGEEQARRTAASGVESVKADVQVDQNLSTTPSTAPQTPPGTPKAEKPKGFLAALSGGWAALSKWLTDSGKSIGDWFYNLLGIKEDQVPATVKAAADTAPVSPTASPSPSSAQTAEPKNEPKDEPKNEPKDKPPRDGHDKTSEASTDRYDENMKKLMAEFGITAESPKLDFVHVAMQLGKEVQAKWGVPWQVVVAQSCLESGDGQSGLTQRALNCFGYKIGDSYGGDYVVMPTKEFRNGVYVTEDAAFRYYGSIRDCFMDYGRYIANSSRYKEAFKYKDDPKRFLIELKKGGYATDPAYVAKAEARLNHYDITLDSTEHAIA